MHSRRSSDECFLMVRYTQRVATLRTAVGYKLGWEQFHLPDIYTRALVGTDAVASVAVPLPSPAAGQDLQLDETDTIVSVRSVITDIDDAAVTAAATAAFEVQFPKEDGSLLSFEYEGEQLVVGPQAAASRFQGGGLRGRGPHGNLLPRLWRAPVDMGGGPASVAARWTAYGLSSLSVVAESVRVAATPSVGASTVLALPCRCCSPSSSSSCSSSCCCCCCCPHAAAAAVPPCYHCRAVVRKRHTRACGGRSRHAASQRRAQCCGRPCSVRGHRGALHAASRSWPAAARGRECPRYGHLCDALSRAHRRDARRGL